MPAIPTPDDVMLEAAMLEHGATVTREDLALAFGWPLTRIERALAALHQRLASTGARLHPVGIDRYVIAPNRRALPADQWIQIGHSRSGQIPLTPDAATALYHLFARQASLSLAVQRRRSAPMTWRTDDWDDRDDALRQLRELQLLDQRGLHSLPSADVRYSLGLTN